MGAPNILLAPGAILRRYAPEHNTRMPSLRNLHMTFKHLFVRVPGRIFNLIIFCICTLLAIGMSANNFILQVTQITSYYVRNCTEIR